MKTRTSSKIRIPLGRIIMLIALLLLRSVAAAHTVGALPYRQGTVRLSEAQVAGHAYNAGHRGYGLVVSIAIARAESNWYVDAVGDNGSSNDLGLWQVNDYFWTTAIGSSGQGTYDADRLFNLSLYTSSNVAAYNAGAAFSISTNGTNWHPWATYYTIGQYNVLNHRGAGPYKDYIASARTAASALDASVVRGSGDAIEATSAVNVRNAAGGTTVNGQAPAGTRGTITGTIAHAQIGGTGRWYHWWQVSFDNGLTGWTVEDFIKRTGQGGGGTPPSKPTNPFPANGAPIASANATLTWGNGGGATSYRVYFGTDSTPDSGEDEGTRVNTSFTTPALMPGATYYWKINSINANGETAGDVWNFTVASQDVTITNVVPDTNPVTAGNSLTLVYFANSPSAQTGILYGASIYPAGQLAGRIDDPANDASGSIPSGQFAAGRQFRIPATAASGLWDVEVAIWKDLNGNLTIDAADTRIGYLKVNSALTIQAPDTTRPTISAFSVTPANVNLGGSFTASFTVGEEAGGSGLKHVVLRRTSGDGSANDTGWQDIETKAVTGTGNVNGTFAADTPPAGTYWYGMAVYDNAGNSRDERAAGLGPVQRTVSVVQTVAIPAISPDGGSHVGSVNVSITCPTAGATIRYTTNGAEPTSASALFSAPFTLTNSATVKARAFKSGSNDSGIATAAFTITPTPAVATPVFSPNGGSYVGGASISLLCDTPGAAIRFTTDGSTPTAASALYGASFTLSATATVKARGFKSGSTDSAVASAAFTIEPASRLVALSGNLAFGSFNVGSVAQATLTIGNTGNSPLTVTGISVPTGFSGSFSGTVAPGASQNVAISFTPTSATNYGGNITVNSNATGGASTIAVSGTGTSLPQQTVATPVITPNGAVFSTTRQVSLTCATSGAAIYFTIDGSNPTSASPLYSAPLALTATTTVKAIGIKTGMTNSAVAAAVFTKETPLGEFIGRWTLDSATVSFSAVGDSSPAGRNGTIIGTLSGTPGIHGEGLRFDGSGGHVSFGTVPFVQEVTAAIWVNIDAVHNFTSHRWLIQGWTGTENFGLRVGPGVNNPGTPRFSASFHDYPSPGIAAVSYNEVHAESETAATPGGWHHVAMTYKRPTLTLYVDGVVAGTATTDINTTYNLGAVPGETGIYLGTDNGPGDSLRADMDEVRIYTRALSAAEIAALAIPPTPATISFASAQFSAAEGTPNATLTLTRSGSLASAASVTVTMQSGSADGADYAGGGTVNFAAGASSAQVNISIADDAEVESAETFTVTLSNPVGATLGTTTTATVTIADNDEASGGDSDSDSLADDWEREHFGSITAQDGDGNPDGDGYRNYEEFVRGMNPVQFNTPVDQPDLAIGINRRELVGANIFDWLATGSQIYTTGPVRRGKILFVSLKNSGIRRDSVTVVAGAGNSDFNVRYYLLSESRVLDVTRKMTAEGLLIRNLAPGAKRVLKVSVVPRRATPAGDSFSTFIDAHSENDENAVDSVYFSHRLE